MDRLWANWEKEDISIEKRLELVADFGAEFRELIQKHLGVDMHTEIRKDFE